MRSYKSSRSHQHVVDTLRLSDKEYRAIIGEIQEPTGARKGEDRRRSVRTPFHEEGMLILEVTSSDNFSLQYLVKCFDISNEGLGFLHSLYVNPGTSCVLTLITIDKKAVRIGGTVVRSQHRKGVVHVVGVKFDEPIELDNFSLATHPEQPQPGSAKNNDEGNGGSNDQSNDTDPAPPPAS